jgi:primase-polymerase (primpol)-like protein
MVGKKEAVGSDLAVFENVPSALKIARHWVGRRGKVPCDDHGHMTRQTDAGKVTWPSPSFWMDFQQALAGLSQGTYDGIGWIVAREPGRGDKQIIGGISIVAEIR